MKGSDMIIKIRELVNSEFTDEEIISYLMLSESKNMKNRNK